MWRLGLEQDDKSGPLDLRPAGFPEAEQRSWSATKTTSRVRPSVCLVSELQLSYFFHHGS